MLKVGDTFERTRSRSTVLGPQDRIGYRGIVTIVHDMGISDGDRGYHGFEAIRKVGPSIDCQIAELQKQIDDLKASRFDGATVVRRKATGGIYDILARNGDHVWMKGRSVFEPGTWRKVELEAQFEVFDDDCPC